ncbi:MAG TPA: DegT/DnrJ/EryC1/StrS family aminotransferase, partial [Bdellovibrionota bacterium]|nr:DegT/DnrJ/EryC1/StrS family aminotransferase [Bdellovibrionota bacterium]
MGMATCPKLFKGLLFMKVPFFTLARQYEQIKGEVDLAVQSVFAQQNFIGGPVVESFEKNIAEYTGSQFAVGCGNGTDALILALRALNIGPGDEVLVPSFTFFATAESVAWVGAKPVFVDIDPVTMNMDPDGTLRAVSPKTKAIIPVHLFGQMVDVTAFEDIGQRTGLPIIEDAAQALGAQWEGRKIGSLGVMTTLSFYPTKNLGGAGEGGMVITNDPDLAKKLKALRCHGEAERYFHYTIGTNSRFDALQAAVLNVKLKYLPLWNERRREIAKQYMEAFSGFPYIQLPNEVHPRHHIYHQFVLRTEGRDRLQKHLQGFDIGTN